MRLTLDWKAQPRVFYFIIINTIDLLTLKRLSRSDHFSLVSVGQGLKFVSFEFAQNTSNIPYCFSLKSWRLAIFKAGCQLICFYKKCNHQSKPSKGCNLKLIAVIFCFVEEWIMKFWLTHVALIECQFCDKVG